jgi:hypothetical protein
MEKGSGTAEAEEINGERKWEGSDGIYKRRYGEEEED